jgi:nucleotide-binding universal stress UspA family protein
MSGPIIVGVDRSDATSAVRLGVSLARRTRRELVLVHVVEDPPAFPYGSARARELQRRALLAEGSGDRVAAAPLAEIAQRAGSPLMVVGTAGGSWISGSVAQRLIASPRIPVLVVPPPAPAADQPLAHAA